MSRTVPGSTLAARSVQATPKILLTSAGRAWTGLSAEFVHIPRGISHVPASEMHRLGIHFGPPVKTDCYCDGHRLRRLQKSGDIDIVPAGVDGSWKDDADCRTLQMSLSPSLLMQVAGELGQNVVESELRPRFQLRDTRIEAIGWAVKAALESATPSDPLYIGLLAQALAVRLIETASGASCPPVSRGTRKLSASKLRILTDYIEGNLDQKLALADLAAVVGVGITQLKSLFRNTTGLPVHQYVIRRRVEYARALIATTDRSMSEIAATAGFSHQSHMASTMRRLLGQTPGDIFREGRELRPNLQSTVQI